MTIHTKHQGFGLLEVVIASGILALVIGAATGLIRSSLRRTVTAAERSVAMNLAQEPIEQLRSARDTTFVDGVPNSWDAHLKMVGPTGCGDDVTMATPPQPICTTVVTPPSGVTGWRVRAGVTEDPIELNGQQYAREVYITVPRLTPSFVVRSGIPGAGTMVDDIDMVRRIHVIVRWDNGNQAVESETYLTNWRSGT